MKYKYINTDTAREICKKYQQVSNKGFKNSTDCDKCPLRRTRIKENGQEQTLFCYFILKDIAEGSIKIAEQSIENIKKEQEILDNEDMLNEEALHLIRQIEERKIEEESN